METLCGSYEENVRMLDKALGVGRSCDMVSRNYRIGGRQARLWVVDGYGKDETLERMASFWLHLPQAEVEQIGSMQDFIARCITFSEADSASDTEQIIGDVLMGKTLLLVEGFSEAALIDAKEYPGRGVEEPPDGKVLRGSHDGFVEAVVLNVALMRRRIRDRNFTAESHKVGTRSRTDVVLCYLEDKVDRELLEQVRVKLSAIDVHSLSMGQESVAEALGPKQWYNPFPKVRFTERPDSAAASVLEGNIAILVDNSPSAMLLPTTLFDFAQEANEFYFPPLVGTYLRLLRMVVFCLSLLITPTWFLLVSQPGRLPSGLEFLSRPQEAALGLLWQLLVVEFLVDVLKLASLNTPDALSSSFSMLGALILGDFAVQAGWLGPEVLVYMAFVSVANFAQPSYELGYAFKLLRLGLLLLTAALDLWGYVLGLVGIVVLLATTKPMAGKGYLYPLIPFHATALRRLLIREPISRDNT